MKKIDPFEIEPSPNKKSKKVVTPEIAGAHHRTKTSDGNATFVIAETL